jgi:dipeptidase D
MNNTISTTNIWNYFEEICQIPRASKKEKKIRNYLIDFAIVHNLNHKTDIAGNVLISKPASEGYESRNTIILQSHMDMVCEKNSDSMHNFDTDAIQTYIDGDWLKAKETTLGADNGIGIAMQLAVLSSNEITHPAIECLFTTDEETGLYGATNLDENLLKGKTLINLDSEEDGEFCIGCAGGMDTLAKINFEKETSPENLFFFEVKVSGLQGGHSGEDINKGKANAIKILSQYLEIISAKTALRIASIKGGNLRNAIPREASALLAVPYAEKEMVRIEVNHFIHEMETLYFSLETKLRIDLDSTEAVEYLIPQSTSNKLITALNNCPHGVIEMNIDIPTLVETSTNLAAIKTEEDFIFIETSQRSAVESKKNRIADEVAITFSKIGAEIKKGKDYPGWQPNMHSDILQKSKEAYLKLFKKEPIIKVIHAGLECGVIAKKYPELDMISIGPTIENPHSPFEKICISSVENCWRLLIEISKSA